MKIVIISDTHEQHLKVNVPNGDLLIHCGDWTNRGDEFATQRFLDWFSAQPYKYKCFIAGNHELTLDYYSRTRPAYIEYINEYLRNYNNLYYLEQSSINIEGLNIYGSPITPFFYNWAFNRQRGKDIAIEWAKIPDDTNVLITHGPPHGILDMVEDNISNRNRDLHQGCADLRNRVNELKNLKAHVFGHLHTDGGKSVEVNGATYVNAAICTESYRPTNLPVVFEL